MDKYISKISFLENEIIILRYRFLNDETFRVIWYKINIPYNVLIDLDIYFKKHLPLIQREDELRLYVNDYRNVKFGMLNVVLDELIFIPHSMKPNDLTKMIVSYII